MSGLWTAILSSVALGFIMIFVVTQFRQYLLPEEALFNSLAVQDLQDIVRDRCVLIRRILAALSYERWYRMLGPVTSPMPLIVSGLIFTVFLLYSSRDESFISSVYGLLTGFIPVVVGGALSLVIWRLVYLRNLVNRGG